MSSPAMQAVPVSTKSQWAGRIVSALLVVMLIADGVMKVLQVTQVREAQAQLGYPESLTVGIGLAVAVSAIIYAIPRTSILGAILLTGYLGGATATQLRVAGPFLFPIVFGVLIWGALFLRDGRLRAMIPLRK